MKRSKEDQEYMIMLSRSNEELRLERHELRDDAKETSETINHLYYENGRLTRENNQLRDEIAPPVWLNRTKSHQLIFDILKKTECDIKKDEDGKYIIYKEKSELDQKYDVYVKGGE